MLDKNYRVIERIGVGGMAVVYLVEHQSLQKQFAAKVLSPEHAASVEARARFTQEAHAASQLDHENIVTISDFGITADQRPYFVMELLRGMTLADRLDEGRMTLEECVAICVPVARALSHAHGEGIIHRDIKPENIFLVQRSQGRWGVKVLDFGIAKVPVNDRMTKTGQALGSPMFMAPEACQGDEVDQRADVYSFGILLYLMFAGRVPFSDENLLKVLRMQVSTPLPLPSSYNADIPQSIEMVIVRALAKDPEDRYPTIDALLSDFEAALPDGADVLLIQAQFGVTQTPFPGSIERVRNSARYLATTGQHHVVTGPFQTITGRHAQVTITGSHRAEPRTEEQGDPAPSRPTPVPAHPPAPRGRGRAFAAVAVLALLGGGGAFAYWKLVGDTSEGTQVATSTEPAPSNPPAAPVPPPTEKPVEPAAVEPTPTEVAPTEMAAVPTPETTPDAAPEPAPEPTSEPAASDPTPQVGKKAVAPKRVAMTARPAVKQTAKQPEVVAKPVTKDAGSNANGSGSAQGAGSAQGSSAGATTEAPAIAVTPPKPEPEVAKPTPTPPVAEPVKKPTPAVVATPVVAPKVIGSLDATPSIAKLDVDGSLPSTVVRRGIERAMASLRDCYKAAAKAQQATTATSVSLSFEIDEGGAARSVSARGGFGTLATCARGAVGRVQTQQAPDVGTVKVTLSVKFTPL